MHTSCQLHELLLVDINNVRKKHLLTSIMHSYVVLCAKSSPQDLRSNQAWEHCVN